jgi:HD-GYP domain-containing protein (c-di-GMP phosphodiesterase class II)
MLGTAEINALVAPAPPEFDYSADLARCAIALRKAFGVSFALWDAHTGELLHASLEQPASNDPVRGQLARAVHGSEPQFLADEDSVLLLAVPLSLDSDRQIVATSAFVTRQLGPSEHLNGAAELLGMDHDKALAWTRKQSVWPADALLRLGCAVQEKLAAESKARQAQREVEKLSDNLASTYEEICLLHGVTQNLRINSDEEQLCTLVLRWLLDCLPARGVAIQLLPVAKEGNNTYKARTKTCLLTAGQCPLDTDRFSQLIETLHLEAGCGPLVANHLVTGSPDWPFPSVHELISCRWPKDRLFGWLLINHAEEANSAPSKPACSTRSGDARHPRRQPRPLSPAIEFLASVVRALTSAIDAKDPYTCGHSDRVARIAVRIAKELGCEQEMLHTLYMAGLLHDIGKIGIDDAVLRKPGKLTTEEFEHIKLHPELGYRILADIKQLADVLPAVLHHHEQWDGRGYPFKLAGDQIPYIARIVAVADAFDAMTSDRPYRPGMPVEMVDEIFKSGGGKQWDPEVINAFFTARQEILDIAENERANLTLDVQQWT